MSTRCHLARALRATYRPVPGLNWVSLPGAIISVIWLYGWAFATSEVYHEHDVRLVTAVWALPVAVLISGAGLFVIFWLLNGLLAGFDTLRSWAETTHEQCTKEPCP